MNTRQTLVLCRCWVVTRSALRWRCTSPAGHAEYAAHAESSVPSEHEQHARCLIGSLTSTVPNSRVPVVTQPFTVDTLPLLGNTPQMERAAVTFATDTALVARRLVLRTTELLPLRICSARLWRALRMASTASPWPTCGSWRTGIRGWRGCGSGWGAARQPPGARAARA